MGRWRNWNTRALDGAVQRHLYAYLGLLHGPGL
jgi:hypothetical protein